MSLTTGIQVISYNDKSYFTKYNKDNPDISYYIKNRLESQINWYNDKATDNMYRYNILQILTLISSSLISIENGISDVNIVFEYYQQYLES